MHRPRIAFVYGTREVARSVFGHNLFAEKGAIGDTLMRCERLVRERLGWSLEAVWASKLFPSEDLIEPSLVALQIALTEGWRERGIEPDVIAGRCGGEIAAEYARGTLVLEDAIEVACRISRLIRDRGGRGRMLRLRLGLAETERLRESSGLDFFVIMDATPNTTIIACATHRANEIRKFLAAQRVEHQLVPLRVGAHSPLIEHWKAELLRPLSGGSPESSPVPFYRASVEREDDTAPYPARLWRTVREPVLSGRMVKRMIADGCRIFVEVGCKPSFAGMIRHCAAAAGEDVIVLPTTRPGGSLCADMDETHETLRRLGASFDIRRRCIAGAARFAQ